MSIFSKLKASKKAAKEHKAAEKGKEPAVVEPYKHVVTHASHDALNGAPATWSREDRSKIREQHRRRSEMHISRTPSSLSTMSYMNAGSSSQTPPLPRSSSHSSFNPKWFDNNGGAVDSRQNRYRPQRGHSYHDSGIGPSPLGSKMQSEETSPVVSSGTSTNSNSSSDGLEIAGESKRTTSSRQKGDIPQGTVFAEQDIFNRLHTSTQRKLGEAPILAAPPASKPRTPTPPMVEKKQKKQRWSLLGKKNTAIAV